MIVIVVMITQGLIINIHSNDSSTVIIAKNGNDCNGNGNSNGSIHRNRQS